MKKNKTPLSRFLKNYDAKFTKAVDKMWDTHDVDKNGWLDRAEAKNFIDAIASIIGEDRAKFY